MSSLVNIRNDYGFPVFKAHAHTPYVILLLATRSMLPWEICSYIAGYYHSLCQRLLAIADDFALIAMYNAVHYYDVNGVISAHDHSFRVQPCTICPWADSYDITPMMFRPDTRILAISAGCDHGVILTTDGVFGCGSNRVYQLGLPSSVRSVDRTQMVKIFNRATAVSCSMHYTMLISNQKLYGCGTNQCGYFGADAGIHVPTLRLVNSLANQRVTAITCQMSYALVLTTEGVIYRIGKNEDPMDVCAIIATNASAIFAIASQRWCFKAPEITDTGNWPEADFQCSSVRRDIKNVLQCWHMECSTGVALYPEWNTPHGRYDVPAETLLALHREQSCLNGETHPTEFGIITTIAQNRTSRDIILGTPNGVFFRNGHSSKWIRL